jgi:hypothetical protein
MGTVPQMTMRLFDLEEIRRFLVEVAQQYAESAPDVSDWAGELYERCADGWRTITLDELRTAEWLRDDDGWVAATLAEQTVSRLLERQSHPHGGGETS